MKRGEKRLELEVDVRAPPPGGGCATELARGEHGRASSQPGVLYRYILDLRIGKHKSGVSEQPEPPWAEVSAGEAWMWRRVNLPGQKSRPGAHAWRGTAWGACARKGRGDGEQGGWGSGAGAGKVGEMMDDGWVRSRAQGGRVRAHLPGEGPPSSPPANVVIGAVGEGLRPPQFSQVPHAGEARPRGTGEQLASSS